MTMPKERTRALIFMSEFLRDLVADRLQADRINWQLNIVARHYPSYYEIRCLMRLVGAPLGLLDAYGFIGALTRGGLPSTEIQQRALNLRSCYPTEERIQKFVALDQARPKNGLAEGLLLGPWSRHRGDRHDEKPSEQPVTRSLFQVGAQEYSALLSRLGAAPKAIDRRRAMPATPPWGRMPSKVSSDIFSAQPRIRGGHVLYLDLDGVAHPADVRMDSQRGLVCHTPGHEMFENMPVLLDLLRPYPHLRIVLSTSWVQVLGFELTRRLLPGWLRRRCVGATYHSAVPLQWWWGMQRDEQVLNDVEAREPDQWLAIDDDIGDGWKFAEGHVVITDPVEGIRDPEAHEHLREALQRFAGRNAWP